MNKFMFQSVEEDGDHIPKNITHLVIHDDVTEIPEGLCNDCLKLVSVTMGDKVTIIHCDAFRNCQSLQFLRLSCGLRYIGMWAFYCCYAIESIAIPSNVMVIEYGAFMLCRKLRLIQLPSRELRFMGVGVFDYCEKLPPPSVMTHPDFLTLSAAERQEMISEWLRTRFEEYPLHQICLKASVSARNITDYGTRHGTQEARVCGEEGMTPLHILARNPNASADSVLACFHMHPASAFHRDENGLNAIDYAFQNNTESLVTMISALCIDNQ